MNEDAADHYPWVRVTTDDVPETKRPTPRLVMNEIRPMGDHYAVLRDDVLIGTVEKVDETMMWGWFPLDHSSQSPLRLRYALEQARKWKPYS